MQGRIKMGRGTFDLTMIFFGNDTFSFIIMEYH